jgi:hypothetical protein
MEIDMAMGFELLTVKSGLSVPPDRDPRRKTLGRLKHDRWQLKKAALSSDAFFK